MARSYRTKKEHIRAVRVLVDMDGVLCDFEGYFLQKYRETFPEFPYIPLEERNTFYLKDQYQSLGAEAVVGFSLS